MCHVHITSVTQLTENDTRDLIPMMVVVKAVMKELVKPAAVKELMVMEVKEEVLTTVEEVKACWRL